MDNLETAANATTETTPTNVLSTGIQPDQRPVVDRIPEKFRVATDNGIDLEASTAKMLESYTYLEKRMGSSSAPPKTIDDYSPKVDIEGFEWEEFSKDEGTRAFLDRAHKLGASNELIGFMLQEHINSVADILPLHATYDAEDATAELRQVWRSEDELQRNVSMGVRAVRNVYGDDWEAVIERNGNNPDFIRMAAELGKGMQEDSPPRSMQTIDPQTFDQQITTLRAEMDALDKRDPRRPAMLKTMQDLYNRRYGDSPAHGL